ncbi:hypothetical protein PC9H_007282 [Pleurotus ostreatus]|uniref:mannan endo-1,4-beta-mannosidase n=1 Tax=Pleurotus ostreatus TaxID=5322 RepID=A0A8H6ZUL1_PLEOS|nr:uncharacterized protein PC9H_007282 [Pleurotus ostreatus]KAF7428063.1 hypothetical protein PC9H_007282 [Pleurotus ostreatus]
MKLAAGLVALAVTLSPVRGVVVEWGQCGGIGWAGETTCASGLVCLVNNEWYSQCVTGTSSVPPTTSAPPTSTSVTPTTTSSTPTTSVAPPSSTGFVKTSGTEFVLNGSKYTVVGHNSYWVGLSGLSLSDMNQAFSDIAATGATTVRTMGFNDQTDPTYWGPYYQLWTDGVPTINTGPTGLENFDNVVALAKANGLRLIPDLSNRSDYGGMDVYVQQLTDSTDHDLFYTDATVIAAYKNYIHAFVSRYVNEPTILAWELANEPRCRGTSSTTSGSCTPATITSWAADISAYIKSIDSNHLVALGDEGFFNRPGSPTYPYQGSEGIDFDANLQISTLDFGTIHDVWGTTADAIAWGNGWIRDHATSMVQANKPVIMEEFGMLENKVPIYTEWFNTIETSGFTGDLVWLVLRTCLSEEFSWGDTYNGGYAIYPGDDAYALLTEHAAALKARPL